MAECPFIDRENDYESEFNRPLNYSDFGGSCDYIYYEHIDPGGKTSLVQFCKLMGRVRDVFQCLNENEWKACWTYKSKKEKRS